MDLSYLAGFFDGEGSVGIYKNGTGHYHLRVQISQNKSEDVVKIFSFLIETYGGSYHEYIKTYNGGKKLLYQISGSKAVILLEDLLPFTILKGEQITVAVSWYHSKPHLTKNSRGQFEPFPEEFCRYSQGIDQKLRQLKRPQSIERVMDNQQDLVERHINLTPLAVVKG